MADDGNTLGSYLRARRALVSPESVGLPQLGLRRVPGLRREEVAMLAGISADYYLRLEQGRDRHPSVQVLESIARVLQLDEPSTGYLLGLAAEKPRRTQRRPRRETVPAGIRKMLASMNLPAFVESRTFDVLAANPLATAISPRIAEGRNRLLDVFLVPEEQALYPEWDATAGSMVAGFRRSIGPNSDDPRAIEVVGELSLASELFRKLWARQDVHSFAGAQLVVDHPDLGRIALNREKLAIGGTAGMILAVYHPDPGSADEEKLNLLASYRAEYRPTRPQGPAEAGRTEGRAEGSRDSAAVQRRRGGTAHDG